MLRTLRLLISITLLLNVSRACDENQADQLNERQDFGGYLVPYPPNPWNPYYYNYQARAPVPDFKETFESQIPTINRPNNYYFKSGEDRNLPSDSRWFGANAASLINSVLFNNRFTTPTNPFRPFAGLANQLPVTANPNFVNPFYESCTAPSGESGVCASGSVCSLFGGRPSGSCSRARVCCINAITTCGGSVTLNNTYWQSPTTAVGSPSTCSLTVKLDTSFVEQKRPICQIRLDLVSFSIAQPDATSSLCTQDSFQVGGAVSTPPTICGDNNGQHMYLEVPSSDSNPSDVQLLFNFGSTTTAISRSWNIKIALLPCGASYLAPTDCLQYFTAATGKVNSFNFKDAIEPRQIGKQNYNICFRTELIASQKATQMCLSLCSTSTSNFLITADAGVPGTPETPASATGTVCTTDFLVFVNGLDKAVNVDSADRYCGTAFNPAAASAATSATVCSSMKPFMITYVTNDKENGDTTGDVNNAGFCFSFQEQ